MSRLTQNYDDLLQFIEEAIGPVAVQRQWPRVDRLITMWVEYHGLSKWLQDNVESRGDRFYKDTLATLNGLMQNIRNLENDLDIYRERTEEEEGDNEVTKAFEGL